MVRYLDDYEEQCKRCKGGCHVEGMSGCLVCHGFVPKTNADRIRAMSDEELANCFLEWVACTDCPVGQSKCKTEWANCTKAALEWLKEDAVNGLHQTD